jgi:small subunit ribosomal protein S17
MTDDETKKDETVDEAPDQGSDESTAGPVAEGDPPANTPEGAPSTPPAEDAAEAGASKDEAPEAAPAAEPNPEDELPWKEKRRLERSRRPHKAGSALKPDERAAKRAEGRKRKAESRRKERAAAKAGKTAGTGTPPAEKDAVAAKMRQGIVVSNKGEKSITVRIDIARRHPTYEKVVRRSRTLHAHDERNEAGEGDIVRVVETRPLSKTKRWRLVEVLERAK